MQRGGIGEKAAPRAREQVGRGTAGTERGTNGHERTSILLSCVADGKARRETRKRSRSLTGGSGLAVSSLLPNVGKKFSFIAHKLNSCSAAIGDKCTANSEQMNNRYSKMGGKGKDKLGQPICTSSGLNMDRPYFETMAGPVKGRSERKTPQLYRSRSVRVDPRQDKGLDIGNVGRSIRARSLNSVELRGQLDSKFPTRQKSGNGTSKEERRKSASGMEGIMEQLRVSSRIVEMSDKLLMPNYMNNVKTDVNNNDKVAVQEGQPTVITAATTTTTTPRPRNRRRYRSRHRKSSEDTADGQPSTANETTTDNLAVTEPSSGSRGVSDLDLDKVMDELPAEAMTATKVDANPETAEAVNTISEERERLEELKEAQERIACIRASSTNSKAGLGRERSRSKDRIQKRGSSSDVQPPRELARERTSSGSSRDCQNTVDVRTEATDSGVGTDATGHHCDQFGDNLKDSEMFARATKAIQEHVKDVTEKTRATCCIGKPPVKKESFNNQYNTQYHGGMKETNFNHHPINGVANYNQNYQQENHRPLPEYAYSPPPPYHSDHHLHQPKQGHYQGNHNRARSPSPQKPTRGQYPGDTRTPPPPIQPPLIISGNNPGYIGAPDQRPERGQYIINENTGTTYIKGRLLGKGGFAKCYELTDIKTKKLYAGKIISKSRLTKPHQKEKILREIELHKSLKHRHVVAFHSYFEDNDNVYIILECCSMKSLVHVLKCRKSLTEPEVRYFMRHLVEGCRYIHQQHVIHRDLKLGNMLLNDKMQTKIADFGLATRVEYEGEKKMTVCGTPNYIAPEVLQKKGHSYEADIWAMGCIMYAMLVGKPPFETSTLKETYVRITANKYFVPPHVSRPARNLITKLLAADPQSRPSLDKILNDEFFTSGHLPKNLPISCCETPPKFPTSPPSTSSTVSIPSRPQSYAAPVSTPEAMQTIQSSLAQLKHSRKAASQIITKTEKGTSSSREPCMRQAASTPNGVKRSTSAELRNVPSGSAIRLYQMLSTCLEQMPEDGNPTPMHTTKQQWVTKWVDYSNKYGFGFQLSDKSVGILFNDTTRILLANDGKTCQYNDLSNKVYTFSTDTAPEEYQKKVTLLLYFAQYMDEHLIHGGDLIQKKEERVSPSGIFMKKWFRTGKAIVMYLNNGTLQVNFFEDHTKVILSPDGQDYTVTYINSKRASVTYRLLQFRHFGCHPDIQERLKYSRRMLESIINIEGEAV